MFTGVVEEIGSVLAIRKGEKSTSLVIEAKKVIEDTKVGDSICTNGVCLTVTRITNTHIEVDVMPETLRRTNLGKLHLGSKVNLERALTLNSRLGGHIVSGHIDGVGNIAHIEREDNAIWFEIETSNEILRYIVEKGSITVDGISLTVAYVDEKSFKVSIIPHTAEETILITKSVGEKVNLESDILAKHIEKLIRYENVEVTNSKIDEKFLIENGFM